MPSVVRIENLLFSTLDLDLNTKNAVTNSTFFFVLFFPYFYSEEIHSESLQPTQHHRSSIKHVVPLKLEPRTFCMQGRCVRHGSQPEQCVIMCEAWYIRIKQLHKDQLHKAAISSMLLISQTHRCSLTDWTLKTGVCEK